MDYKSVTVQIRRLQILKCERPNNYNITILGVDKTYDSTGKKSHTCVLLQGLNSRTLCNDYIIIGQECPDLIP